MRTPLAQTLQLDPGDVIVLYTDGVSDRFTSNDYPGRLAPRAEGGGEQHRPDASARTTTTPPASRCGTAHDRARADQLQHRTVGVRRAQQDPRPRECARLRRDRNDPPRDRRLRGRASCSATTSSRASRSPWRWNSRRRNSSSTSNAAVRLPEASRLAGFFDDVTRRSKVRGRLPGCSRAEAIAGPRRSRRRTRSSPNSARASRTSPAKS